MAAAFACRGAGGHLATRGCLEAAHAEQTRLRPAAASAVTLKSAPAVCGACGDNDQHMHVCSRACCVRVRQAGLRQTGVGVCAGGASQPAGSGRRAPGKRAKSRTSGASQRQGLTARVCHAFASLVNITPLSARAAIGERDAPCTHYLTFTRQDRYAARSRTAARTRGLERSRRARSQRQTNDHFFCTLPVDHASHCRSAGRTCR